MSQKFNTLGITRKKYDQYLRSKGKKEMSKKRFSKASLRKTMDEQDIIRSNLLSSSTKTSQIELSDLSSTPWIHDYTNCCNLLSEINTLQEDIAAQRAKKLIAIDETKHLRTIQYLHQQSTRKINTCEKILKSIGSVTNYGDTPEQKKLLSNVVMSLAMKIRESAKSLRQSQQKDLQWTRQMQQFDLNKLDSQNLMHKDEEIQQFDEQEFEMFQKKIQDERNQQIMKIVTSIHSLNTMYKELQSIVIQQGSLLDRIDENIDTAASSIKEANQELKKAQQHQKSPLANRVKCILICLIGICLMILLIRSL